MSKNKLSFMGDGKCVCCRQPLGQIFRRIRIDHAVINVSAVRRRMGLSMMLGSDHLAAVMGDVTDDDLVRCTEEQDKEAVTTLCVHDACLVEHITPLAMLIEAAGDRTSAMLEELSE